MKISRMRTEIPPQKLKEFRIKAGWSWAQMAKAVGVSVMTVYRWETGKVRPSPLARRRLLHLMKSIPPAVKEKSSLEIELSDDRSRSGSSPAT